MRIRAFKKEDSLEASNIIKNCYLTLSIGRHTEEGIKFQIKFNSPKKLIERSNSIRYFVAEEKGRILGICGYDKKKVHTLFVDKLYHNKGIGRKLLEKVLLKAKKEGIKSIITWSTFYAEKFYRGFGFKRIGIILLPEGKKDVTLIEMKKIII